MSSHAERLLSKANKNSLMHFAIAAACFQVISTNQSDYHLRLSASYHEVMAFPIKVCVVCGEEFELKPDKPGFANRCPECSAPEESTDTATRQRMDADERKVQA